MTEQEWINRNMRCIEILKKPPARKTCCPINRNMRCIEIRKTELLRLFIFD